MMCCGQGPAQYWVSWRRSFKEAEVREELRWEK